MAENTPTLEQARDAYEAAYLNRERAIAAVGRMTSAEMNDPEKMRPIDEAFEAVQPAQVAYLAALDEIAASEERNRRMVIGAYYAARRARNARATQ